MNGWSVSLQKSGHSETHDYESYVLFPSKIDPNAHQGKEATENLSEHKRRLQMDSEAESHEINACHVKVTKISYIYISI